MKLREDWVFICGIVISIKMSEVSLTELTTEAAKPVQRNNDAVVLPPFPGEFGIVFTSVMI